MSTGISPAVETTQARPEAPGAHRRGAGRALHAFLLRASFGLGAVGLLSAMLIDVIAVGGRQLGWPLLGSIELSQCCVVLFASSALVGTTLQRGHASVHLLTERLPDAGRRFLLRSSQLLSALFFAALAAGSLIVLADLWRGDETTELLGLPFKPLRLVWCSSALLIVVLFVGAGLGKNPEQTPEHPHTP